MRLQMAWAFSLAGLLQKRKQHDGRGFGRGARGEGNKAHVAAEKEQGDPNGIPDPAISQARGSDHPVAEPSRRPPAVNLPHDLIVAGLYEIPDHSSSRHGCT